MKRFFLVDMLFVLLGFSPRWGGAIEAPNIPDAGKSVPGVLAPAPGANA
ncbi:MAG: hypothetical protein AB7P69_11115 [Candidatus Binatia bacterium]